MKDRYLFKAKRLDNGEWVKGALVYDNMDKLYRIIAELDYSTGTCIRAGKAPRVDASTICQCTGLKDKNGKLIWENDIIRTKVGPAKVIWDKSEWRIEWIKNDLWRRDLYYWAVKDYQKIAIIGNIFDNKELLKNER